jgi:P-type Cu+ transporter
VTPNLGNAMLAGIGAALTLLGAYFGLLALVSGWDFTLDQFLSYRYFIIALAASFGIQVGLFVYLKVLVQGARKQGVVLAASGTTSTAAMVSCCTHYLANITPIIGAAGLVTFATQYQVELFWVGLAFNAAGIFYISSKVFQASKEHVKCVAAS